MADTIMAMLIARASVEINMVSPFASICHYFKGSTSQSGFGSIWHAAVQTAWLPFRPGLVQSALHEIKPLCTRTRQSGCDPTGGDGECREPVHPSKSHLRRRVAFTMIRPDTRKLGDGAMVPVGKTEPHTAHRSRRAGVALRRGRIAQTQTRA
ncbi:hypothetical protein PZ897_00595 [Hoeflea sp. YIM 152468]|uniref:hypothetical protein n=1 Tax=Hoeflea sp. YIM 152468 TaxID=3031759 RepID=UPI0023D9AE42|nr:hypothetical protein [Hoeflea sp. YIM 152468]MDF1606665.1 hypothetical protein [Hoeflea sp. YIM 152468]